MNGVVHSARYYNEYNAQLYAKEHKVIKRSLLGWFWRLCLVPWAFLPALPIWLFVILPLQNLKLIQQISEPFPLVLGYKAVFPNTRIGKLWRWAWDRGEGFGGGAFPFGFVVNIPPDGYLPSGRFREEVLFVVLHELRHTDQCLVLGPLFLPLYLICAIPKIFGLKNIFEVDADRWAMKALKMGLVS